MAKTAAERKAVQRAREQALEDAGLVVLKITTRRVELGDYLRSLKLLSITEEDDPAPLARGVERLLIFLTEGAVTVTTRSE